MEYGRPYLGHVTPLSESLQNFSNPAIGSMFDDTFVIVDNPDVCSFTNSLSGTITTFLLPQSSLQDLPTQSKIDVIISHTMAQSLPSLRDVMEKLKTTVRIVTNSY